MRRLVFTLCCVPGLAGAADVADLPATLLAGSCGGCHGVTGQGANGIPAINRTRSRAEFAALLRGYRTDQGSPTVTNRIARGYTDAEYDLMARRWALPE